MSSLAADAARPIRIAIVGCGKIAQNVHIPGVERLPGAFALAGLCDADAAVVETLSEQHGRPRTFTDPHAMFADPGIEAVIIAVGDPLHVELTAAAAGAGKHVLVEKPLGLSVDECRALMRYAGVGNPVVQPGVMRRSDEGVAFAARAVRDLGPVRSFNAWYRCSTGKFFDEEGVYAPLVRGAGYARPVWKHDRATYALDAHGTHLFDCVRFIAGVPVQVNAIRRAYGEDVTWQGLLELDTGGIGRFELTVETQAPWSEGFEVSCERGTVRVDISDVTHNAPSQVQVFSSDAMSTQVPALTHGNPYVNQLRAFAAAIRGEASPPATVEDGIGAVALIEALRRSVDRGGTPERVQSA